MRCDGWIFDAYPVFEGMRVWAILVDGRRIHFVDPWRAPFIVEGSSWDRARPLLAGVRASLSVAPCEGADLYSEIRRPGWEVRVPPPLHGPLVKKLKRAGVVLYNADFHPIQHYHYERGHFPLAFGAFHFDEDRWIDFSLKDDPWSVDFSLPPLRFLHVALAGSEFSGVVNPNHASRGGLVLRHEGLTHVLEGEPAQQLETLERRVREWDPDVLTTDWGDSYLIPHLLEWGRRAGRPLCLSRDPESDVARQKGGPGVPGWRRTAVDNGSHKKVFSPPAPKTGRLNFSCHSLPPSPFSKRGEVAPPAGRSAPGGGRSFMTYGQMMYQASAQYLFGRWHLDLMNSFYFKECGWEGLYEIARIAKIPVQRAARTTIGTSLASMQLDVALRRGLWVPMDKAQAEDFRPASDLVVADKGGLVYEPDVGWFEQVAEYDFISMYPALMVKHNISPETVNCGCCRGVVPVPEIGHHLCRRRRGLVPEVLAPILIKRAEYKRRCKAGHPRSAEFKARADAHKWALVCCFGYLGYKNARFGKIEAHESVTAWGREILLRAKDSVEKRGFHVLHANVDCVWIQGRRGMDFEGLRRDIEDESGCPVGLEGVYKWLRFCPSKSDQLAGVPNRYFGAFTNGELKVRGLALRRRDTPEIFKKMQNEMLSVLAEADDVAGCRARVGRVSSIAEAVRERIAEGRVEAPELAITVTLSKDPSDYVANGPSAVAVKRLSAAGVKLHPGESVRYLITSSGDKVVDCRVTPLAFVSEVPEVDTRKYLELWRRCRDEILA